MQLDEALGERQAKAGSLGANAAGLGELLELAEQAWQVLLRDPDAGVGDAHHEVRALGGGGQAHQAPARRELDGVRKQILEDLLQALRVCD